MALVRILGVLVVLLACAGARTATAADLLRVGLVAPFTTLDPTKYIDTRSIWIANQIFEPLVRLGPHGEVVPWLAEKWTVSADRQTYTFHLRQGVVFADGTPLSCEDVQFTFARTIAARRDRLSFLKDLQGAANLQLARLDQWQGIRCRSEHLVEMVLTTPSAFFLYAVVDPALVILPRHSRGTILNGSFFHNAPFGTGPFVVDQWGATAIRLARNMRYWGMQGAASDIEFVVQSAPSHAQGLDAICCFATVPKELERYVQQGFHLEAYVLPSLLFIGLNTQKPPWNHIANRRLFIESIDWARLRDAAYPGAVGALSGSIIPYGILGHDPGLRPYPYKPDYKVLANLFQRFPSARNVAVSLPSDFEALRAGLEQLYLPDDVALRPLPDSPAHIVSMIHDKVLETFALRAHMNSPDAFLLLEYFQTGNPMNFFGWSDAYYDQLAQQARQKETRHEKYELYVKMAARLREGYLVVPLQSQTHQQIFVRDGLTFEGLGDVSLMYYQLNRVKDG